MRTVSSIIAKVKRRYPDIPQDHALELLNTVNRELHRSYPLAMSELDITLVQNQAVYPLPLIGTNEVSSIWGGDIFEDLGGPGIPLIPSDQSLVAEEWPGYRQTAPKGIPRIYFQENAPNSATAVRFLPVPDANADGKIVRLYVSTVPTTDLGMEDSVPNTVPDDAYVYVRGIAYYWAVDRHPEGVPLREKLYLEEKAKLEAWLMRRVLGYKPRFYLPSRFRRDIVI